MTIWELEAVRFSTTQAFFINTKRRLKHGIRCKHYGRSKNNILPRLWEKSWKLRWEIQNKQIYQVPQLLEDGMFLSRQGRNGDKVYSITSDSKRSNLYLS